jgi:enoyl-CoA hydratase/carnithine racemase
MQPVLFDELEAGGGRRIGIARLNSPATLNAVSLAMTTLLAERFAQWAADPGIAMVMLEAEGGKAFCAGGDLQSLYRAMRAGVVAQAADFFAREYRLNHDIHFYPKPLLCWGHGIVMGGGMGLMVGASHRVVTETSRLAMPEIVIGLFPDVGMSWMMDRMPAHSGRFLALTGATLHAADALFAGWADHHIAHARRQDVIDVLRAQDWTGERQADGMLLDHVLQACATAPEPSLGPLRRHLDEISRRCRTPDLDEAIDAILQWSSDDPWVQGAQANLAKGAPSTARLGWELQRRVGKLSLARAFQLEYGAAVWCCTDGDFQEGIRALLIDKDRQPVWSHARGDVDRAWGERVFAQIAAQPLPPELAAMM